MNATQSASSTSLTLLARVRRLEPSAWERFVPLYSPVVYRWCRQSGLQEDDAADISQEVFRVVAVKIGSFRYEGPRDSFRGWLWTITRNKVRDFFRASSGKPRASGGSTAQGQLQEVPDSAEDPDVASGLDTQASLAHRALQLVQGDFAEHTWEAFVRLTLHGEPADRISEDLGMSVGAVHTARWRVLRRLRDELEGLL